MKNLTFALLCINMTMLSCNSKKNDAVHREKDVQDSIIKHESNQDPVIFDDPELDKAATDLIDTAAQTYHKNFLKKALEEDPEAMFEVGSQFHDGYGCLQSYESAFMWWSKAANKGEVRSMNNLGYCYRDGVGVSADQQKATEWFQKSANEGDTFAMYNVYLAYLEGRGVAVDNDLAIKWLTKSAKLGYPRSIKDLYHLYNEGGILPKDSKKADYWKKMFSESIQKR